MICVAPQWLWVLWEEIIDDNHAIISTSVGSEYYVNILSFVDKDLIEPGCTVLFNNKVSVHERSVRLHACRVYCFFSLLQGLPNQCTCTVCIKESVISLFGPKSVEIYVG